MRQFKPLAVQREILHQSQEQDFSTFNISVSALVKIPVNAHYKTLFDSSLLLLYGCVSRYAGRMSCFAQPSAPGGARQGCCRDPSTPPPPPPRRRAPPSPPPHHL